MANRRKVPSSSAAMSGTLTRSKSDIFLHRTRSGKSRPDPNRHHHHQPKDLRLKRVFSRFDDKRSEPEDSEISKRSSDDDSREATPPVLNVVSGFDEGKGIRVSEETNMGNLSECNLGLSSCSQSKVIGNPSSNSYRRLLPYLMDLAKDGSSGIQILQSRISPKTEKVVLLDIKAGSEFDGCKGARVCWERNLGNSSENKQVPSPCSRSKLIVNQSSISYKRLLPYLKDLDKDDSTDIKVLQSHNHWPKVEETMNETTLVLNPSYKQQDNVSPFSDSPMVNSGGNCDFAENPVQEKPILNSDEDIVQNPIRIESPIHEATGKVWFNDEHMDELNGQEQKGTDKERCIFDAENSKVSAGCSEDMTQSTPPDVDLTRKLDDVENGSRRTILDSGLNNAPKENMGLVLCSRSKLYRNPSSFSYRRLLPYLMDLAKNDPNGLEIIQSHNHAAKVNNSIEERPTMLNDIPSPSQQHHTATLVDSSPVCLKENQDLERSHVSESPVLDSQGDIHDPKVTKLSNLCNKNEERSTLDNSSPVCLKVNQDLEGSHVFESHVLVSQGDIHDPKVTKLPNLRKKNEVQVLGSTDQISPKRLDFEFEMCKSSSCSEDLSFEELAGGMMVEIDRNHNKKVSQFETFGLGMNRALAPRKSILKKHTRGCKGICMCLDCASFRLHAERAYEFSRRQMSSADEVVERLMKELSCLRNVMERSLVPTVDCDGSCAVLQVNQEQVKRVCQRSLGVEEQVKSCIRQMFCDLNAHCKIPGPRVTFSDAVDERIIP